MESSQKARVQERIEILERQLGLARKHTTRDTRSLRDELRRQRQILANLEDEEVK